MTKQGFIAVPPDADEEFEEDQTERIVSDTHEFPITGLDLNDTGGSFTALGMKSNDYTLSDYYQLYPLDRKIFINAASGYPDSECQFEFRD